MEQKKDLRGRNLKQNEDQLKDGRYRYRYTDRYGNRKAIYAWKLVKTDKTPTGKREDICLREKEKNLERDIDDGIKLYQANMITVSQLIFRYLETKTMLANSTLENYKHITHKNIESTNFGKMKVSDVKKSDVMKYYNYLHSERKFSSGTIQLYQNLIFPAFQLAVDDDMIRKNPCKDCMKGFIKNGLTSTKYPLSRDEQKNLLNFVKNDSIYSVYYTMIAFMLSTGCRIGETIGVSWKDINFDEKYVSINHQIIYKKINGRTKHYSELPKNRTTRIIPLKDDILSILREYKIKTYFMSKANDYEVDGYSEFVFLNRQMKLYTPNTLTRTFHGIRDAYNKSCEEDDILLPDFSAHTLRHTFCTRMAENGMDVKVLQEIMGHKTIEVTMQTYNHISYDRTQNEMSKIESALAI